MAVHHWNSITEVAKLTQSTLIPGVIEESIYRGPVMGMGMPVAWTPGYTIKYNRENATMVGQSEGIDIGDQLSWGSNITYTQKEVALKRRYVARLVDNYIPDVYGTINNYEAQVLMECKKGVYVDINDLIIYGDTTYSSGNKEFDGMHAWVAEQGTPTTSTSGLNMDGESAGLNLWKLRLMMDAMKVGVDLILFPYELSRRYSAAYQELGGEVNGVFTSRGQIAQMTFGVNDIGKRVAFWDSIPIMPTDYLVAEEDGTGTGATSNARAKYSSDSTFSIFGVKFGNVYNQEPGFMYGFGATEMAGDLYKMVLFDELEDYDASGIRIVTYGNTLLGSKYGLSRMADIDDDDFIIST